MHLAQHLEEYLLVCLAVRADPDDVVVRLGGAQQQDQSSLRGKTRKKRWRT